MRLQVAIACFLVLLGSVELFQWFKARNLPMPMLMMGGVLLAVGSNYDKLAIVGDASLLANRLREYLPTAVFEDSSKTSEPE
jgi:hypothetical protein